MSIPGGYDLFGQGGWPAENSPLPEDIAAHPLYEKFIEAAKANAFDPESGGFRDSEHGYFLFFLLGADSQRIGTVEAGPLRSETPVPENPA